MNGAFVHNSVHAPSELNLPMIIPGSPSQALMRTARLGTAWHRHRARTARPSASPTN